MKVAKLSISTRTAAHPHAEPIPFYSCDCACLTPHGSPPHVPIVATTLRVIYCACAYTSRLSSRTDDAIAAFSGKGKTISAMNFGASAWRHCTSVMCELAQYCAGLADSTTHLVQEHATDANLSHMGVDVSLATPSAAPLVHGDTCSDARRCHS